MLFSRSLRGRTAAHGTCAVVTPVGPGHAGLYRECAASVRAAWRTGRGAFSALQLIAVEDGAGELGRSRARNRGVEQAITAGAEWVFFLDADDLMHETAFKEVAGHLADYDALWGLIASRKPGEDGHHLRLPQIPALTCLDELVLFDPFHTLQMGHFVRTTVARAMTFDERLDSGEDFDYYLRVWRQYRCIKMENILFINRLNMHASGPRAATGEQWREAALAALAGERERRGLAAGSERAVSVMNACIERMQQFYRRHDLCGPGDHLVLSRQFPYRGLHELNVCDGDGFVMFSDNDDPVCASMAWTGEYAAASAHLWHALARGSGLILDIGAGTGFYTLLAARAAPRARVICFESLPEHCERLEVNVAANRITNVQIMPAATVVGCGKRNPGMSALDEFPDVPRDSAGHLVRIGARCAAEEVLRSMRRIIEASRPDFLLEAPDDEAASRCNALLHPLGYHFYAVREVDYSVVPIPASGGSQGWAGFNRYATVRGATEVEAIVRESGSFMREA